MTKSEFIVIWERMTDARKGAAVEAYFKKTYVDAQPIRSDFIDFKYKEERFDIKANKNGCPRLNKNQIDDGVSILWYDWSSVCEIRDEFQILKISSLHGEVSRNVWAKCRFSDFSKFVSEYKNTTIKNKKTRNGPESRAKKLRDLWAAANLFPRFNQRYGENSRFLLWKNATKGMEPALLNGKYEKYKRTIVVFYENIGADDAPNLEVKKWWLFIHDRPADQMKKFLKKHKVDEKYYATKESFKEGVVIEFEGNIQKT